MESRRKEKARVRSKGKEKALPQDQPLPKGKRLVSRPENIPLPASPEASSSKLPARRDEWEYVPIAQNEISRVPPVWSRDGR